MRARRTRLRVALLAIRRLVVDLAAQVVEALAVGTLTHHQPGLDAAAARLGALRGKNATRGVSRRLTHESREPRQTGPKKAFRLPSHLSPVAVDPLRARARLAGALLAGSTAVLAVVGRVAVLILADHHPPLETAGARAGTLHGAERASVITICFF